MKVEDLPNGKCSVIVYCKNEKEPRRVHGEIIKNGTQKHLIAWQSPKRQSFGPGTKVNWYRKG